MTQIASDSFTGTDGTELSAYDAVWSKAFGFTGDAVITDANRVRPSSTTATQYIHSVVPSSADYSVSALITKLSTSGTPAALVVARSQSASSSTNSYYWGWQETSGSVEGLTLGRATTTLYRDTTLGGLSGGKTAMLDVSGASPDNVLKCWWNGVLQTTYTDATAVDDAGNAGIRWSNTGTINNATIYHIDDFSVDEVAAGPVLSLATWIDATQTTARPRVSLTF